MNKILDEGAPITNRADAVDVSIARMETTLATLTAEVREVRTQLEAAQTRQTNWPGWIAAAVAVSALMLGLYGASIRPLEMRLERAERMVDDRTQVIQDMRNVQAQVLARLSQHEHEIEIIQRDGAPITATRLAVIENVLKIPR